MNIFYFDRDPFKCAEQHCDKHIVKMITETGQILCSVLHNGRFINGHYTKLIFIKFKKECAEFKEACEFVSRRSSESYVSVSNPSSIPLSHTFFFSIYNLLKLTDKSASSLYKPTHQTHPCVKWAASSLENYDYLYRLFVALSNEYTKRYGKVHAAYSKLNPFFSFHLHIIKALLHPFATVRTDIWETTSSHGYDSGPDYFYSPPQCVDDDSKTSRGRGTFFQDKNDMIEYASLATILSYRKYYRTKKSHFAKWKHTPTPSWFSSGDDSDILEPMKRLEEKHNVVKNGSVWDFPYLTYKFKDLAYQQRTNNEAVLFSPSQREFYKRYYSKPLVYSSKNEVRAKLKIDVLMKSYRYSKLKYERRNTSSGGLIAFNPGLPQALFDFTTPTIETKPGDYKVEVMAENLVYPTRTTTI